MVIESSPLFKKWKKAKKKLERAKEKEVQLREQMEIEYIPNGAKSASHQIGDDRMQLQKQTRYSIPRDGVVSLKKKLDKPIFKNLFHVSYSIKEGAYKNLADKHKNQVDKVLTIKPAPCTITLK